MSEIKLAKCPFCDAELKRWDYMPNVFFEHPYNGCILSGKKVLESEHDIDAWNTRKLMERIIERLEEEKDYMEVYSWSGARCPDEVEIIKLDKAISVVKEVGGIE